MGFEKLFPWKEENHIEEIWKEYRKHHVCAKQEMAPYEELKKRPGYNGLLSMAKKPNGVSTQNMIPPPKAMILKEKRVLTSMGKRITGLGSGFGLMRLRQRFLIRTILSGSIPGGWLNTGTAVQ